MFSLYDRTKSNRECKRIFNIQIEVRKGNDYKRQEGRLCENFHLHNGDEGFGRSRPTSGGGDAQPVTLKVHPRPGTEVPREPKHFPLDLLFVITVLPLHSPCHCSYVVT